jgi:hypothetical protein
MEKKKKHGRANQAAKLAETLSGDTIKLTTSLQISCNANQTQYHQISTYFTQVNTSMERKT